ncbi:ATPase, T2SS/T4P/T4SS family [Caballeronia sp. LjRoot34]|uniref:ATPase, T2SS/T4P/T4SS family n=1 Tax=Caballeronia sp. LjRoot34 TaxID=3342325 RepID=UPI003ECF7016
MGLFGGIENDEPEARSSFFKRLRAPKNSTLVESAPAAEPYLSKASRPVKAHPSFLGRSLTADDVEDVESSTVKDTTPELSSLEYSPPRAVIPETGGESPSVDFDRASVEEFAARTTAAHLAKHFGVGSHAAEPSIEAVAPAPGAVSPPTSSVPPAAAVTRSDLNEATELTGAAEGNSFETVEDQKFVEEADSFIAESGRPELVSAEALPDYKRILTSADDDAALRIPAAARKEFIALELQPGIAISVATAKFCERAQYATFIKDLANNDVFVREEMVASEAVIAAVYAGKTVALSKGIREASRAIGNFRDIIEAAHAYGASDVHFEPRDFQGEVEVRFRVNSDLYTFRHMPKAIVRRALFAAYSDLVQRNTNSGNSFQPSAPQSAMIPLVVKTDTVNLRWQSSPLVGGYDVALRLLDGNFKNYKVLLPKDMGYEASQLAVIDTLNYVSGGVTALTGETGSGKTTTLRALSYMLPDRDLKKQFAVNEPSEYPMPWLSDYSIIRRPDETDGEANRKYAEVIRTLMRQDPDDLTIGEVRDKVVMGLVAELALTGHPVRFSLHAGDVIAAIMRMAGGRLQLPIDELAAEGFINAVGNQKLIPTLCEHCKIPAEDVMSLPDLEILRSKFGVDTSKMACRNMDGCTHCRLDGLFTRNGKVAGGTKRPTLVAELYRPTPEFLDRISVRDWEGARRVWRGERKTGFDNADMTGKTLYEHALYKASQGLIDPQFINRSMQSFAQYRVMPGVDGLMA